MILLTLAVAGWLLALGLGALYAYEYRCHSKTMIKWGNFLEEQRSLIDDQWETIDSQMQLIARLRWRLLLVRLDPAPGDPERVRRLWAEPLADLSDVAGRIYPS